MTDRKTVATDRTHGRSAVKPKALAKTSVTVSRMRGRTEKPTNDRMFGQSLLGKETSKMKHLFFVTGLSATALMNTATLSAAYAPNVSPNPTPSISSETPLQLAETQTKENRDDRQEDRQGDRDDRQDTRDDCREAEGAGKDKRDCKQEGRQDEDVSTDG